MCDAASLSETSGAAPSGAEPSGADTPRAEIPMADHQRAVGDLRVSFKRRDGRTVLDGLRQAGCLKARFPRVGAAEWTTGVMLNTGGGVAGGDRLDVAIAAGAGVRATMVAQAAERFYRSIPGGAPSLVRNVVTVAPGAALEWLPQETILFDRCALDRRLDIGLADDAWFLGIESVVFGRLAMGETVLSAWLRDGIRIRRGGRLIWQDTTRLDGAVAETLARPAVAAGARAMATLVHVAPDAGARLDAVRGSWPGHGEKRDATAVEMGASAWDGMLIARILAPDAAALRRTVIAALAVLRDGRPLPRLWNC